MTQKSQNDLTLIQPKVLAQLQAYFNQYDRVTFGFLFGSRVVGSVSEQSDWDFALWVDEADDFTRLGMLEDLRSGLSGLLGGADTDGADIDIVDLQRASLSIADTVVADGLVVKGQDCIELKNYYTRIWALLEDFDWRRRHEL